MTEGKSRQILQVPPTNAGEAAAKDANSVLNNPATRYTTLIVAYALLLLAGRHGYVGRGIDTPWPGWLQGYLMAWYAGPFYPMPLSISGLAVYHFAFLAAYGLGTSWVKHRWVPVLLLPPSVLVVGFIFSFQAR